MRIQASQAAFINGAIHVRSVFTEHRSRSWVKRGHGHSSRGDSASLTRNSASPHPSAALGDPFRRAAMASMRAPRPTQESDNDSDNGVEGGVSDHATSAYGASESAVAQVGDESSNGQGRNGGGGESLERDGSSESERPPSDDPSEDGGAGPQLEASHDQEEIVVHEKGVIVTSDGQQFEFEAVVAVSREVDALRTVSLKQRVRGNGGFSPAAYEMDGTAESSRGDPATNLPTGATGRTTEQGGGLASSQSSSQGALIGRHGSEQTSDTGGLLVSESRDGVADSASETVAEADLGDTAAGGGGALDGTRAGADVREKETEHGMRVDDKQRLVRVQRLDVRG